MVCLKMGIIFITNGKTSKSLQRIILGTNIYLRSLDYIFSRNSVEIKIYSLTIIIRIQHPVPIINSLCYAVYKGNTCFDSIGTVINPPSNFPGNIA